MIEPTDEMVTAAAEVAEDEMIRRLGRDLGTIHRNDIIRAILAAGLAIVERDYMSGRCTAMTPRLVGHGTAWCEKWQGHTGAHQDGRTIWASAS